MTTIYKFDDEPFFLRYNYRPGIRLTEYHRVYITQWNSFETYCGLILVDPRVTVTTTFREKTVDNYCPDCEYEEQYNKEKFNGTTQR